MLKILLLIFFFPTLAFAEGFVVLELFTSQGCSSCPAADAILSKYHKRAKELKLPIITLSEHVDYWNYLGWDDPYSNKEATVRQRQYAVALNDGQAFTPQLIINGEISLVGSEDRLISETIHKLLKNTENRLKINHFEISADKIKISINAEAAKTLSLNFFLTKQAEAIAIQSGENSGRKLGHSDVVVKSFLGIEVKDGENIISLPLDKSLNTSVNDLRSLSLIAVLQSNKTKKIFGSDQTSLAGKD